MEENKEVSKKKCFSFNEFMKTRNWKNFGIMGAVVLVGACILCANVPQVKVVSEATFLAMKPHSSIAVQLFGETKFFDDAVFSQDSKNVYVKTSGENWKKTEIFRNESVISVTVIDGDAIKDAYGSTKSVLKGRDIMRMARLEDTEEAGKKKYPSKNNADAAKKSPDKKDEL